MHKLKMKCTWMNIFVNRQYRRKSKRKKFSAVFKRCKERSKFCDFMAINTGLFDSNNQQRSGKSFENFWFETWKASAVKSTLRKSSKVQLNKQGVQIVI